MPRPDVEVLTEEMKNTFIKANAIANWAMTLYALYKAGEGQPVVVDVVMFSILEEVLNDEAGGQDKVRGESDTTG